MNYEKQILSKMKKDKDYHKFMTTLPNTKNIKVGNGDRDDFFKYALEVMNKINPDVSEPNYLDWRDVYWGINRGKIWNSWKKKHKTIKITAKSVLMITSINQLPTNVNFFLPEKGVIPKYSYNMTIEEIRHLPNKWQRMVLEYILDDCKLAKSERLLCELFQKSGTEWRKRLKLGFPEAYKEFKKCYPSLFE